MQVLLWVKRLIQQQQQRSTEPSAFTEKNSGTPVEGAAPSSVTVHSRTEQWRGDGGGRGAQAAEDPTLCSAVRLLFLLISAPDDDSSAATRSALWLINAASVSLPSFLCLFPFQKRWFLFCKCCRYNCRSPESPLTDLLPSSSSTSTR